MPVIQRERRKNSFALKALAVLIILMLLLTNIASIYLLVKTGEELEKEMNKPPVYITVPAEAEAKEAEPDPDELNISVSAMLDFAEKDKVSIEFLQRLIKDRILIWADDSLHSVPINEDLKPSDFDSKNIVVDEESTIRRYEVDGEDISLVGVDVSSTA